MMKRTFILLSVLLAVVAASFGRTFDGTEKLYLNAYAVNWWTNDNAVQRAVLDNTTPVIGEWGAGAVYAFTIPAGDFTTIRFERASSADAAAWNKTGEIVIDATLDYVSAFSENSTNATWQAYKVPAVQVLSINNSLIDYNNQYEMFNSMAATMGKDAVWTKHTNLGKTLAYHYNEDPLVPNAKTVVASVEWSYIILQEQSGLPQTNLSTFYTNVNTWVTYIRANCPNPDVKIILPVNWAYSNDDQFQTNNSTLIANYKAVADDFNLILCPVAAAYGNYRLDYPSSFAADLYSDDRHPTQAATYLACCIEYATIFGENPSTITWKPAGLTEDMAARMRTYAQEAYEGTERTEPTPQPTTEAMSITGASVHSENFDTIGGEGVTPTPGSDGKTAVEQASTLPKGWRIENNTSAARSLGSFAGASATTRYIGGISLASNDKNGTWNFGATGSTDRAVGGITSSISGGARTVNLMVHLHNDANVDFSALALQYDIEKYRNGANAAGFTVQLYSSTDGVTWTSAGERFKTSFAADANTNGAETVPMLTTGVQGETECVFPKDGDLYLAWSISVSSGTDLAKSMALAIDNISITPVASAEGIEKITTGEWRNTKKLVRNGMLLIERNGKLYSAQGTIVER